VFINLLDSNNVFEDIFIPHNLRNTTTLINLNEHRSSQGLLGTNISNDKLNVYFYRYIGFNSKDDYIKSLNILNERLSTLGNLYIRFDGKIPQPYNMELTDKVTKSLSKISEIDIRNERGAAELSGAGIFNISKDENLNTLFKNAFYTVMKLYAQNEPVPSLSIEKNLIIKLMLWANVHVPKLFSSRTENCVPKVVYYGSIKKHEVYYLIMLSQIGCDVLYINSENEGEYLKVDKNGAFAKLKELPIKGPLVFEFKEVQVVKEEKPLVPTKIISNSGEQKVPETKDNAMIILKEAINIFEDITFPLSKRIGYVGLPCPVLPIYFYRCIGIPGEGTSSEDEYYNMIFSLDKKLINLGSGYVKFINQIPMPMNNEIEEVIDRLKSIFSGNINDKNLLVKNIAKTNVLVGQKEPLINKIVNTALERVLNLYLNKEPSINIGRFQNFIYKLIVWLNRYYKVLFVNKSFNESPKVLHFGDIKAHEVYFLILLSNIGCDVLYLTTEEQKDKPFVEIDPRSEVSSFTIYEKTLPMRDFPEKEIVIRKSTTAFNASREIDNILYNQDVGLFRPWQFEDYTIRPITLKTTYDELKLLWREESKIRPEFKVDNGTVYVPNLFAKISGTPENLEQYFADFKHFAKSPNTFEVTTVPFTKIAFTKQEMYSLAFLLDKNGFINKEGLQTSNYYKFSYLRTSLQNLLVEKINELLKANCFIKPIDNNFKLLIIMTIITLDEGILKLIETFDYPTSVPKLVVYNNSKEAFSDEDAIIIAFLNSIGFDITIFTPTNYNTIEQKLHDEAFDKFQLPTIQYDLQLPTTINNEKSKSLFSRMFGI
jgi:hypothetical protein